jgi:hypothetical protein
LFLLPAPQQAPALLQSFEQSLFPFVDELSKEPQVVEVVEAEEKFALMA